MVGAGIRVIRPLILVLHLHSMVSRRASLCLKHLGQQKMILQPVAIIVSGRIEESMKVRKRPQQYPNEGFPKYLSIRVIVLLVGYFIPHSFV
jgi:hypothetical protein